MLTINLNLVWTIINLIILYFLLKRFLIGPVVSIMNQRQELIEKNLTSAKESEKRAAELEAQYEEKLSLSRQQADQVVVSAKQEAQKEYSRIVKEAGEQADKIVQNAYKTTEADRDRAMREAQGQIANLVVAAAIKVMSSEGSEEQNQMLYDKYIAEAGDSHGTNGN